MIEGSLPTSALNFHSIYGTEFPGIATARRQWHNGGCVFEQEGAQVLIGTDQSTYHCDHRKFEIVSA